MGASESALRSRQQQQSQGHQVVDEITTVSERVEGANPILERVQALKIATPLLKSLPLSEGSLTDILLKNPSSSASSSSISGTLNPKVLLELFSLYREWQEEKAKKISKDQLIWQDILMPRWLTGWVDNHPDEWGRFRVTIHAVHESYRVA